MPEASHETLVVYLREHGESHTLEALRKSLLRQGYDATAVDEACRIYLAETPHTYQGVSGAGWTLRVIVTVVLGVVAVAILLVGGCVGGYALMMAPESGSQNSVKGAIAVAVALYLGLLVIFVGIIAAAWYVSRPIRPGKRP
ncbi:MAG TPA: hypothetical protein VFE33_24380 [Thermoanaerobaculia bacterium]|nr:hypothetical protein [Thermoanaerobaculia bacterium]